MKLVVESMQLEDIPQVLEVDRESYTLPWPASAYRREILHNRNAKYFVLRDLPPGATSRGNAAEDEHRYRLPFGFFRRSQHNADTAGDESPIAGYAGMWLMIDEAHITTIAVRHAYRGRGLGELLLATLILEAAAVGALRVTLEVRVSNETAQKLYRKYGFVEEGVRPRYYSDNNEDAYIMTTSDIADESYRARFSTLVERLRVRFDREADLEVAAGALTDSAGLGLH